MSEWSVGDLPEYGVYWIDHYIGNSKKTNMALLNYYDELPAVESNEKFYMFDSYDDLSTPIIISNSKIIKYSKVVKPN